MVYKTILALAFALGALSGTALAGLAGHSIECKISRSISSDSWNVETPNNVKHDDSFANDLTIAFDFESDAVAVLREQGERNYAHRYTVTTNGLTYTLTPMVKDEFDPVINIDRMTGAYQSFNLYTGNLGNGVIIRQNSATRGSCRWADLPSPKL